MTPVKALGFFWAAVAYASLEACQPIQIGFNGSLYVPGLGCHSACGSAASINPAYSLQPDSSDTWASHASAVSAPADLAVLDLCNQVQSIWLMQGMYASDRGGGSLFTKYRSSSRICLLLIHLCMHAQRPASQGCMLSVVVSLFYYLIFIALLTL